jgi:hypothetical protein
LDKFYRGLAYSNSIDDFLDQNQGNDPALFLGKLAIVREIIGAESKSKLRMRSQGSADFESGALSGTWLLSLARMLFRGVKNASPEPLFENVRFITFNYDRSLEKFLPQAIEEALSVSRARAVELVSTAEILHAYGSLGPLPDGGRAGTIQFGGSYPGLLELMADRIITYTETASDEQLVAKIKGAMRWAEQIVFLGFGFHQQNMDLLRPADGIRAERVFATVKGVSEMDQETVRGRIADLYLTVPAGKVNPSRIVLREEGCADFLRTCQITLPA